MARLLVVLLANVWLGSGSAGLAADVSFQSARPVWPQGETETMNAFFRFRTDFQASSSKRDVVLRITAGYDYKAWLNGTFVSFGPARCAPGRFRVDEWTLKARAGGNVLEIDVAGYNCNNFYLPDQTPFLQAEVVAGGKVVARTGSDGNFLAYRTGRVCKVPRFSYQRTFAEVYRIPHDAGAALPLDEQPPKRLLPREWAKPDFHVVQGFEPVSLEHVRLDASAKLKQSNFIVSEQKNYKHYPVAELEENPYYDIQRLKTVSRENAPVNADGWYALADSEGIVFSGAREEAGFPMLKVRCQEPTTIYFTFDELLQGDGSVDPFRAETIGTLVWHLGRGEYALEGFEPIAFKCARVLAVGGAAEVTAPSVRTYVSPLATRAMFKSSDPALGKIFNAARKSYEANAVDCLTDCPIRERAGWLGDTFFTGRASKWLTGSTENERLFLENFLMTDRFDCKEEFRGLVPAVWPVDLMCDACFIPNWNQWLVLELEEFLARGGDPDLVRRFEPLVMGIVDWFARHCNSDGILEKLPGWVFVEWSKANDLVQDVNYPSNMMYAKMLDSVARLYGKSELKERAAKVRETVRRQSLTADGWYCDNAVRQPDGTLKLSGERTETCQYYAFFTGVADKKRDALLWKRLVEDFGPSRLKNAKWEEEGLWARLHTPMIEGKWKEIWPANFIFGTCLRLELLSEDGRGAQVHEEVRDYFLQMAEQTGTLWEHCDPRASCCHGFASIAVEYLMRDVLGFKGVDASGHPIVRRPAGLDVDWCEAVIPTSATGTVSVVSGRQADGFPYSVSWEDDALELNSARISSIPFCRVWPGHQREISQTEMSYFVRFDRTAEGALFVRGANVGRRLKRLLPLSEEGSLVAENDDLIRLRISSPGAYVIEFDGLPTLHVFADPPLPPVPVPSAGGKLIRFVKGEHFPGVIAPKSGDVVVLDEGAVVYGSLFILNATNVTVMGRGIFDGSRLERADETMRTFRRERGLPEIDTESACFAYSVYGSENVTISGVTFRDPPFWTLVIRNQCHHTLIDNIHIVGNWRYNSDGVDVCASADTVIRNSFFRTYDDCLIARGPYLKGECAPVSGMVISNCSMYCDWGVPFKAQVQDFHGSTIEDVTMRDCRILAMRENAVQLGVRYGCDLDVMRRLTFEDIELDFFPQAESAFQIHDDEVFCSWPLKRNSLVVAFSYKLGPNLDNQVNGPMKDPHYYRFLYEDLVFRRFHAYGEGRKFDVRIESLVPHHEIRNVTIEDLPEHELIKVGDVQMGRSEKSGNTM